MENARAFLGKRVTVDSELLLAYAEKSGRDPLEVGSMFGAKLVIDRPDCHIRWNPKVMGYECSSCGRIMRASIGQTLFFCPFCGKANVQ